MQSGIFFVSDYFVELTLLTNERNLHCSNYSDIFCISCDKNDSQNPNDKTEIWRPALSSIRDDSSVRLFWLNPVTFEKILLPFTYIDPDRFKIYMSKGDPQHLVKIADLDNDKKYSYNITNLTNGLNYFIAVKAIKHGKEPLMSDTIMVMPSVPEIIQQLTDNTGFPMESGSISKDNKMIVICEQKFYLGQREIW